MDIGDFPNFESAHSVYPSGYSVNLPRCSGGNRISDFECNFLDYRRHEQVSHMPSLTLWGEAGIGMPKSGITCQGPALEIL